MNPIFLSSATLQPLPHVLPDWLAWRMLRSYGFDGLEVLLTKQVLRDPYAVANTAAHAGLRTVFHRWWPTRGEGDVKGGWHNTYVTPYLFPAGDVRLEDALPQDFGLPVVTCTYSRASLDEHVALRHARLQPTITGMEVIPFDELKGWIRAHKARVVFDVGHWLQYLYWPKPVTRPRALLHADLVGEFMEFRDQIDELHVYDVAEFTATGMNRFPGDGMLDIPTFLYHVKRSGWQGQITWEINPFQVFPHKFRRLAALPRMIRECGL